MDREGHDEAVFFIGPEVETTPAQGMKTLFVIGIRSVALTLQLAKEHNCKHIYLGANKSFQRNKAWNDIIPELITAGYRVTLDYPVEAHTYVTELLDTSVASHLYFIPMASCEIAYVETFSKNLVVKIDDIDFKSTNTGVWCVPAKDLLDRNRYTPWGEYTGDQIIMSNDDIKALRKNAKRD